MLAQNMSEFKHTELLASLTDDTHFPADVGQSLRTQAMSLCTKSNEWLLNEADRLERLQNLQKVLAQSDFESGRKDDGFRHVDQAAATSVLREIAEAELASRGARGI